MLFINTSIAPLYLTLLYDLYTERHCGRKGKAEALSILKSIEDVVPYHRRNYKDKHSTTIKYRRNAELVVQMVNPLTTWGAEKTSN
jgi:hypothetical protein